MEVKKFNILDNIRWPEDLRKLSVDELPQLCKELREDIVQELSVNPGHLASSLGVVEITVALHYVFNTPEDRARAEAAGSYMEQDPYCLAPGTTRGRDPRLRVRGDQL